MQRPEPDEYDPFYATYIDKVPPADIFDVLKQGIRQTVDLLANLPTEWETFRYAPDKWSIREVIGHVLDAERLFAYRALAIARNDPADQPGMDQDIWASHSNAHGRPLSSLLNELHLTRLSNLALFAGLDPAVHRHSGRASGYPFTVRTFPFIIAGHEIHHRQVVEERYLEELRRGESADA